MKLLGILSLLLWPFLCLGGQPACISGIRFLLEMDSLLETMSEENLKNAIRKKIRHGMVHYSENAERLMESRSISKSDVRKALLWPLFSIKKTNMPNRSADPNEYTIIGLNRRGNPLAVRIAFEKNLIIMEVRFSSIVGSHRKNL